MRGFDCQLCIAPKGRFSQPRHGVTGTVSVKSQCACYHKYFAALKSHVKSVTPVSFSSVELYGKLVHERLSRVSCSHRSYADPNHFACNVPVNFVLYDDIPVNGHVSAWSRVHVHDDCPGPVDVDIVTGKRKSTVGPLTCVAPKSDKILLL